MSLIALVTPAGDSRKSDPPLGDCADQDRASECLKDPAGGAANGARWLTLLDGALARLSEKLHVLAAFALFGLALLVVVDVLARGLFSMPIAGTSEIVSNAVVGIVFLQLSQAIRSGGFLRVEMLDSVLPFWARRALFMLSCALGAALFAAVAYSSWGGMVDAWRIGEYDGVEGSLKVPTAPIRTIVFAAGVLATVNLVVALLRSLCFGVVDADQDSQ